MVFGNYALQAHYVESKISNCMKFIFKILEFFSFNLKMSKKDALSSWRLLTFMSILPSCEELKSIIKQKLVLKSEQIFVKVVLEMHAAFLKNHGSSPFKVQMKELIPASKRFYKQIADIQLLKTQSDILLENKLI